MIVITSVDDLIHHIVLLPSCRYAADAIFRKDADWAAGHGGTIGLDTGKTSVFCRKLRRTKRRAMSRAMLGGFRRVC